VPICCAGHAVRGHVDARGGEAECARTASGRGGASARECVHLGEAGAPAERIEAVDWPARQPAGAAAGSRAHQWNRRAGGTRSSGAGAHLNELGHPSVATLSKRPSPRDLGIFSQRATVPYCTMLALHAFCFKVLLLEIHK
jgi:hypothetical protein